MPIDNVPVPAFPNVPLALGVPPVLRSGTFTSSPSTILPTLLTADALLSGIFASTSVQQWGIYQDSGLSLFSGNDAISVLGVDLKHGTNVPSYPIEQGAFGSYNKVQTPFDGVVRFAINGTVNQRTDFLDTVIAAMLSTNLYTVAMPEFFYSHANIVNYSFVRRPEHGAQMLVVDVFVKEIRPVQTGQLSNTADHDAGNGITVTPLPPPTITNPQQPSGASAVHDGTVQPVPVSGSSLSFPDSPSLIG